MRLLSSTETLRHTVGGYKEYRYLEILHMIYWSKRAGIYVIYLENIILK